MKSLIDKKSPDSIFIVLLTISLFFFIPISDFILNPYYLMLAQSTLSLLLIWYVFKLCEQLWMALIPVIELGLIFINFGASIPLKFDLWVVVHYSTVQTVAYIAEFFIGLSGIFYEHWRGNRSHSDAHRSDSWHLFGVGSNI